VPIFVVTHYPPAVPPRQNERLTFRFVTEGVESAIEQAKTAADDRVVQVVGGPSLIQQPLDAGLVDELRVGIMPVVLGDGLGLLENLDPERPRLEKPEVREVGGQNEPRLPRRDQIAAQSVLPHREKRGLLRTHRESKPSFNQPTRTPRLTRGPWTDKGGVRGHTTGWRVALALVEKQNSQAAHPLLVEALVLDLAGLLTGQARTTSTPARRSRAHATGPTLYTSKRPFSNRRVSVGSSKLIAGDSGGRA
jgi:hypothetical protein